MPSPRPRRSILFAPGSRPERFGKALASGADAVCLDLEDGVAPADKDRARAAVRTFLEGWEGGGAELVVRVNDPRTAEGRQDLEALRDAGLPDAVIVPKAEGPEPLERVAAALGWDGGPALLPLVETATGLHRVEALATGFPVGGLVFGGMDLSAELGARFAWEPLLYARSRVVHAAALAGVGAVDVPWPALDDAQGLEEETRRAARLGFSGKLAIHPAQVDPIHRGMAPDSGEVERARRIVEADAEAGGGVVVVDGRMVDRPVVLSARRVLERAAAARPGPPGPGSAPPQAPA